MHRSSGILLHPTSLPGPYGVGDLGPSARRFVDFLAAAGQGLWQMLPLGPTGYRDSPYQCTSSLAANPLLISPDRLLELGWVQEADLTIPEFTRDQVDFGAVGPWKYRLLERAMAGFEARATQHDREDFARFCETHSAWLDDYALYHALKTHHELRPWTDWAPELARRDPSALAHWASRYGPELQLQRFIQYVFARQWSELRAHARERGVRLVGDMPIFVAHDSSEVWTHPEWFQLNAHGCPQVIAGVPPDYFSNTGQRWGNPLYDWSKLAEDGYAFWIERLRRILELVDMVRIDHFRGFAAYWEIPASEETAINGHWVRGPGMALFQALRAALGEDLPLIAEDLGVITEDVEALRDALGLPGMAVLQFGFEDLEDGYGASSFLPHNHRRRLAVYTGTHDNNTSLGWWAGRNDALRRNIGAYLGSDGSEIHWDFIRAALRSTAAMAVFPLQDVLGLGAEACMNRPGTAEGNWVWRYRDEMLTDAAAERLRTLSRLYGRIPYPAG
ncbi:4-alpha-glucanotransferase [Thiorhodococcus mannitoliphagus]|uniref:4-alpha-glucanotransferase n=1 Tax=Thiorhodococcus mannitoliphagus TaxID=329406 RepID=A0A6P1DTQ3_9GAMM|nr:4-alpha-glucanotransferase [Thiorhodococcus mannitoliphagus]NEX19074.1 4-alpha-glucanotransferase [Thiorhodococcus mannitoliphagus]